MLLYGQANALWIFIRLPFTMCIIMSYHVVFVTLDLFCYKDCETCHDSLPLPKCDGESNLFI